MPMDGAKGSIFSSLTNSFNCSDARAPEPRLKPRESIMEKDIWTFPDEGNFASFTEESRRPRVCYTPTDYGV